MNLTEEQVIELFEQFLDENYYVGELTEANVLWVYEEEFLPTLEESLNKKVQEEQQISPKMQAYLNEMNKKGTKKPIEYGSDGATTRRDVIIARLQAKEKKSGLSREEAKLLAKLIAAEEKEDSGKQEEQQISLKMQAYLNEMSNSRQQATERNRRDAKHEEAFNDVILNARYAAESMKDPIKRARVKNYHKEIGRTMDELGPAAERIHKRIESHLEQEPTALEHYRSAMKKKTEDSEKKK